MGKFLLLAFRNVFRNRRRTVMTLFDGGQRRSRPADGRRLLRVHVSGSQRKYDPQRPRPHPDLYRRALQRDEVHVLDTGIDDWRKIASSVQSADHVRGVAPRIEFYGMLSNGVKSSVFMGSAVDPDAERNVGFSPLLAAGRDLNQNSSGDAEALIGTGVARSMNVKVGDGLTILAVTADGALNGIDVQIVGIVNSGFKDIDDRYLRIALPAAQRLLQSSRVTNLVVGLDATENTDKVAAGICTASKWPLPAHGSQKVDRLGYLLQTGAYIVQRHIRLPRRDRFCHGADGDCEHVADDYV